MGEPNPVTPASITGAWLTERLNDLGATANAVADTLRRHKIKGEMGNAAICPIAMYLIAAIHQCLPSALPSVAVTDESVSVNVGVPGQPPEENGWAWASLPEPVADFVERFDAGIYPDLIETARR